MKQSLLGVLVWVAGSGIATVALAQPAVADAIATPGVSEAVPASAATSVPESPSRAASTPPTTVTLTRPSPTGGAAPAPAPPQTKKAERIKSPWGDIKSCQDPEAEQGSDLSTDCAGVFGIRATITRSRGVTPGDQRGLMLSTESEEYVRRGIWTARTLHRLGIGGGEAGFEGIMMVGWAGGVRLPVSPSRRHGPVLRLGLLGYLRGNNAYYASLLELPQLQLGYQYQRGKTVVELGATGGAILVGRNRIGDSERRVLGSGFEYGGYAALQFPWIRLGISSVRLPANDALSTPVDVLEGTLCARVGGFAVCADARRTATRAIVAANDPAEDVRSLYAGLTLGVTRE